jgi:hypothetical protein
VAAQPDALGGKGECLVEVVPLVGHLAQSDVSEAGGGQGRLIRWGSELECVPVGLGRRVQLSLSTLDLA